MSRKDTRGKCVNAGTCDYCAQLEELSKDFAKRRARCSTWCTLWNSWDNDCEAYGDNHLTPSRCPIFLNEKLRQKNNGNPIYCKNYEKGDVIR